MKISPASVGLLANASHRIVTNEATHMAVNNATGVAIGGVGASYFRPWVFPFYAPSGRTVVQAYPHAHPWHNGIFVGQHPVLCGEKTGNFWGVPPQRAAVDVVAQNPGRIEAPAEADVRSIPGGLEFDFTCLWRNAGDEILLTEKRTVRLFEAADAHFCEVISTRTATHGPLRFPQTKFGWVGLRVEPLLTPEAGAVIIADEGRRGTAEVVHEMESDFVAYEAPLPASQGGELGICLMIRDAGVRGPWFIRDFGMAMYNPTWTGDIEVPAGEAWTVSLRVVAYDGALTPGRLLQWQAA